MKTNAGLTEMRRTDSRWTAVTTRDRTADGRFVYAVHSTGVYCRPSCPSRRPTRSAVDFFRTSEEACAAGFRPCRRCNPDHTGVDPWVEKIGRACIYLSTVEGAPSLAMLARRLGGSRYHLQRNFKRIVGVTPREFAAALRLSKVKQALRGGLDVTTAVLQAGYGSHSRFYQKGAAKFGMAPASYRRGGVGATIRYATRRSPIGALLVATTDAGICSVSLGDDARALKVALAKEFPSATLIRDNGRLSPWIDQAIAHLAGRLPRLDLPLDVRATAFQWQVWEALQAIPRGQTRTYRQVAEAIGRPLASRAVARACATNPVALAIPCHRVVPGAGGVGGYRWGAGRKQKLLEREGHSGG